MSDTEIEQPDADVITCGTCGAIEDRPPNDGHSWEPLWAEGWRWVGRTRQSLKFMPDVFAFSCPTCPSVLPEPRRPEPAPLKRPQSKV